MGRCYLSCYLAVYTHFLTVDQQVNGVLVTLTMIICMVAIMRSMAVIVFPSIWWQKCNNAIMKAHLVEREYRDYNWERRKEDDYDIDQDDDDVHGDFGDSYNAVIMMVISMIMIIMIKIPGNQ